ncbi:MAG TPA: MFS transporter [Mycobacteriales bacterium]|nr:MFS transporter [Mycobacteriales bacterium]
MATRHEPDAARGRRAALVVVCGILALTFLDTTVVSVSLSSIQDSLHFGVTGLQWIVDAYALAFASLMLTGGTLGDRFGRRRVMLVGLVVFCLASLAGAVASSRGVLIAARAVMGVGAAASEPGTLSVLRHIFPDHRGRARALSVWAAVSCLGLALGPLVGGVLVSLWSWRAVFWLNVLVGAVLYVAARAFVAESADPATAKVDVAGQVLGVVAIGSIVTAMIQGESSGYGSAGIVALFVVGAVCLFAFVACERAATYPMLDVRYFRRLRFTAALVVSFAVYFGTFSIFFFTALYLEDVVKYSGYRTAALFVPMTVLMVGGAIWAGRLVVGRGGRWTMAAGCLVAGSGIAISEPLLSTHPSFGALTASLGLTGLGMGLAMVPVTVLVLDVVPPEHSGMAASATNTARQLGVVFGVAILGGLVNHRLTADLRQRLSELHIPSFFQGSIINAYEHGGTAKGGSLSGIKALFPSFIDRIYDAAYGAFHSGLSTALFVSATLIGLAALVAGWSAARGPAATRLPLTANRPPQD